MQEQILAELKDLKSIVYKLAGISEDPINSTISIEAIQEATKEFRKLEIQRGEWVTDYDLDKYFKGVGFGAGKFIREVFDFKDYFNKGRTIYYKKSNVLKLREELKSRNVDLASFIELNNDKESFQNCIDKYLASNPKGRKPFALPEYFENINLDKLEPPVELVQEDLKKLHEKYVNERLERYISVFNTYASLKINYPYERYFDEEIKKRCRQLYIPGICSGISIQKHLKVACGCICSGIRKLSLQNHLFLPNIGYTSAGMSEKKPCF